MWNQGLDSSLKKCLADVKMSKISLDVFITYGEVVVEWIFGEPVLRWEVHPRILIRTASQLVVGKRVATGRIPSHILPAVACGK
jgi:hypothetical protein